MSDPTSTLTSAFAVDHKDTGLDQKMVDEIAGIIAGIIDEPYFYKGIAFQTAAKAVIDRLTAPVASPLVGEKHPVYDEIVRSRSKELHQKLGRDAMLRQNDPVETIYDFAWSIWHDGFGEGMNEAALSAASIPTGVVKTISEEQADFEAWGRSQWVNGQSIPHTAWMGWEARAALVSSSQRIPSALISPSPVGVQDLPVAGDTDGPVPTHECEFCIGQAVHLASPYPEDDPNAVYYVTGVTWEHRFVPHRGWNIAIATAEELSKGHGQTDGFSPSDLRAASRIVLHQITGNGPGVIGADNCQICGRWFNAPETDVCKNTPVDAHPAPERAVNTEELFRLIDHHITDDDDRMSLKAALSAKETARG